MAVTLMTLVSLNWVIVAMALGSACYFRWVKRLRLQAFSELD